MNAVLFGILAAERTGPSPFHDAEGVTLKTLVDIAGVPMLQRVLTTVSAVAPESPMLCGPALAQRSGAPWLEAALAEGAARWLPPEGSPARSAQALWEAAQGEGKALLLTTGDHPLLTSETLERFWREAVAGSQDVAVGLAPYEAVQAAFLAFQAHRSALFLWGLLRDQPIFSPRTQRGESAHFSGAKWRLSASVPIKCCGY
jgi:N-acetylglucosamine-1-phosphate uridyltransferase (contains nucleotidyltransferase and I-patch acetyltransferase domains)